MFKIANIITIFLESKMTQTGSPYDNAVAERIKGILEQEFGLDEPFDTIWHAKKQVDQSTYFRTSLKNH